MINYATVYSIPLCLLFMPVSYAFKVSLSLFSTILCVLKFLDMNGDEAESLLWFSRTHSYSDFDTQESLKVYVVHLFRVHRLFESRGKHFVKFCHCDHIHSLLSFNFWSNHSFLVFLMFDCHLPECMHSAVTSLS